MSSKSPKTPRKPRSRYVYDPNNRYTSPEPLNNLEKTPHQYAPDARDTPPIWSRKKPNSTNNALNPDDYQRGPTPPVQTSQPQPAQQPPQENIQPQPTERPGTATVKNPKYVRRSNEERGMSPIQDIQKPQVQSQERAFSPVQEIRKPKKVTREYAIGPDEPRASTPPPPPPQPPPVPQRKLRTSEERSVGPDRARKPPVTRTMNERKIGPDLRRSVLVERANSPALKEASKPRRLIVERGSSPAPEAQPPPPPPSQPVYQPPPPQPIYLPPPEPIYLPPQRIYIPQPIYHHLPPQSPKRVYQPRSRSAQTIYEPPPSSPKPVYQPSPEPPKPVYEPPPLSPKPVYEPPPPPPKPVYQPPPPKPVYQPQPRPASAKKTPKPNPTPSTKWYVVVDLKGTVPDNSSDPLEIIEISIVLINGTTNRIEPDQFHSFVRPTKNRMLSQRCKEQNLGIRQYYIDQADDWNKVLPKAEKWLAQYNMGDRQNYTIIADWSNYTTEKLMQSQCRVSGASIPSWAKEWVNLRKDFRQSFGRQESLDDLNVYKMLQIAQLQYEGKRYDGRDECFNLALIAVNMMRNGFNFNALENMSG